MPEKEIREVSLPSNELKPEDFEVDAGGNLVVKNSKIAEMIKAKIDPGTIANRLPGEETQVHVSVGVDF